MDDLVANRGPADFAAQFHIDAVLCKQTEFLGNHERRAVGKRDEAHTNRVRAKFFAQRCVRVGDARRI